MTIGSAKAASIRLPRASAEWSVARECRIDHLVAAKPACNIFGADAVNDAVRHFAQHGIAAAVAERIVHKFEIVEIDEQDRDLRAVGSVAREFVFELFEQHAAGWKGGERVVRRLLHQLRDQAAQALDFRTSPGELGNVVRGVGQWFPGWRSEGH